MKVIIKCVDMGKMCDVQIKQKQKKYPKPNIWLFILKWNKTLGKSFTLSILCGKICIFLRKLAVLAKQEQNSVTVFGSYVLVLCTEMKSEPPCIVITFI